MQQKSQIDGFVTFTTDLVRTYEDEKRQIEHRVSQAQAETQHEKEEAQRHVVVRDAALARVNELESHQQRAETEKDTLRVHIERLESQETTINARRKAAVQNSIQILAQYESTKLKLDDAVQLHGRTQTELQRITKRATN
ncbi:hypothetical protein J1614_007205 [Plenodomus biglobosus]|nr:hypothetical protein J1614_007205 [Plenodomus biglobosus]